MELASSASDNTHDHVRVYYEMIRHMPVGVAIWKLEKGIKSMLRLVCSNTQASHYVGVPLQVGRPIHDVLPNGLEVHRFLEEVVRTQRVSSLEKFRTLGHEVSVTAFPLHHEYVAVVLEPPKTVGKDAWASSLESSGVAVAVCEGMRAIHCNEHFATMIGIRMGEVANCDPFMVLEQRSRLSRGVEELRRAIRDARIHQVDIELEQRNWRMCTQPLMDGGKRSLLLAYRLAPPMSHHSTFPILPDFRATLPPAPKPSTTTTPSGMDSVFSELVDNFPNAIALAKAERLQDKTHFRIVALNKSARLLSKYLVVGKCFDEMNPSPFDLSFVRLLVSSSQERESRVFDRLTLGGSHLTFVARTIPLREFIGISLEENRSVPPQPSHLSETKGIPNKRPFSDIDRGHPILPSPKHSRSLTAPVDPASSQQPVYQFHPPTQPHHSFDNNDIVLPFANGGNLPKPILPPIQSHPTSTASDLLCGSERERLENRIFRNCVIAIACIDVTGKFCSMNRAFSQTLGYQESDLIERSIFQFLHPEDSDQVKGLVRQLACGDILSYDIPIRFVNKRVNSTWALASFLLNRNTQGEPSTIVLQLLQPAKMKHYPEVILSDFDVLRSTFRELAVGSAVLDASSSPASPRIVSANSAFCSVLGSTVSENELTGHALVDIIYQDDREKVLKAIRDMLSSRIMRHQMSVRTLPKSGPTSWAALSLAAVLDSKSLPFLLVAQLQLVDKPFP